METIVTLQSVRNSISHDLYQLYDPNEADSLALWLLEEITNLSSTEIRLNPNKELRQEELFRLKVMTEELMKGKPVQYIIGKVEFMGCFLKVNPSVLIPRPETEELCRLIIKENKHKKNLEVLDVCTGSGCIALSLKKNLEHANVSALDISESALNLARENAAQNKAPIEFIACDILNEDPLYKKHFDIVVSNPPYVTEGEMSMMKPNVLDHEPHLALFVKDEDPLIFYKEISKKAIHWLNKNGMIYFEINENKGDDITELLKSLGYNNIQLIKDIYDKRRFVSAQYI